MLVDRRLPRPPVRDWDSDGDDEDVKKETQERYRRIQEQWRFDVDDEPAVGPEGPEEHGRKLIDDYTESYVGRTFWIVHISHYYLQTALPHHDAIQRA